MRSFNNKSGVSSGSYLNASLSKKRSNSVGGKFMRREVGKRECEVKFKTSAPPGTFVPESTL